MPESDARSVGAPFISAHLLVRRRCQRPPKGMGTNEPWTYIYVQEYDFGNIKMSKHARKHETRPDPGKKYLKKEEEKCCQDSNNFGFICSGVSNVGEAAVTETPGII